MYAGLLYLTVRLLCCSHGLLSMLQCVALEVLCHYCSVLQCLAVSCSLSLSKCSVFVDQCCCVLQCVAVCCFRSDLALLQLQSVAVCQSVLLSKCSFTATVCCSILHFAVCCSVLQCVARKVLCHCGSALQCVAVCSVLLCAVCCVALKLLFHCRSEMHTRQCKLHLMCFVLKCVAVCCNVRR